MGGDHQVERVIPERHLLPQTLQHDRRVAPAVDEHLPPVGGLDERGIPLPHIEEGDVQPAIGALPPPRPGQQDDDRQADQRRVAPWVGAQPFGRRPPLRLADGRGNGHDSNERIDAQQPAG